MGDGVDPADLARLRSRRAWAADVTAVDDAHRARRRAECAAARKGHLEVVLEAEQAPRCAHCGETLSPDALRRAGVKAQRS